VVQDAELSELREMIEAMRIQSGINAAPSADIGNQRMLYCFRGWGELLENPGIRQKIYSASSRRPFGEL